MIAAWKTKPRAGWPLRKAMGLTKGLVMAIPFNDGAGVTAYDDTPNGNNATFNTGASWAPGLYGPGAFLNNTATAQVSVANSTSIQFGTGPFSYFGRMRIDNINVGVPITLALYGTTNQAGSWYVKVTKASQLQAGVNTTSTGNIALPTTLVLGTWHSAALTRTPAGLCTFYIDGAPITTLTNTLTVTNASTVLNLGWLSATNFSQGVIDSAFLWNRSLDANEVLSLHNSTAQLYLRTAQTACAGFSSFGVHSPAWLLWGAGSRPQEMEG